MKFVIFVVVFIFFQLSTINCQPSAAYQESLGRVFALETTLDPDRYVILTANGTTIHAAGYFRDYAVTDFYISTPSLSNIESRFTREADGTFIASFGGIPSVKNALAVIKFNDDTTLTYRVEYNSDIGWFFGDNRLAAKTAAALEDYRTISPQISENYISAALCPREIAETRSRLHEIVAEVTAELDCDYQKAKELSRWVSENIVYDRDAAALEVNEETISIANTLRLRRSVCIGIANTYAALLEAAGIKALNIKGGIVNVSEGVPYELLPTQTIVHEWVAFWYEAENRWVYTDPTWDRQGVFQGGEYLYSPPVMKYFDISSLALSFDHRGDSAEFRQFFAENDTYIVPLDEAEPEALPSLTTLPASHSPPQGGELPPYPAEDDSFLYMIIGALSLAAAIMVIIIFRYRKS
ncbi:MAG: transglutaminase-like domain-containing protein [Oscillospiraceae bacterium]|jgi:transglutaminase-like putative cysteine protease|nr:transglutaminase-like domain-containing protein [Oscillospiraceae bacterium]